MQLLIHPLDAAIVVGYLAFSILLGLWVGRGQKSTLDYFLGNRSLPTWAVLLSIVATETSTVTFLSIPGFTFAQNGDMRFLQITFGYILGRLLVIWILLPRYFEGQPFTAYEVLQKRFGVLSRRVTSALFLVTRNLSDALRLFLTALALQQVVGLELTGCIVLLGVVTIIYTFLGGVKSVVWNDCLQFFIYIAGAIVALWLMISRLPGGWEEFVLFGEQTQKFHILDFDLSLTKSTMTFWAGLIGGIFLTAATHGTDQLMVQRYLSSRSQKSAAWALALSGLVVCLQFALFLFIGVGLASFYEAFPLDEPFQDSERDKVFAHFIVHHLSYGLVGITLSAVFAAAMSTLSGSLNSSATVLVQDIYLPLTKRELTPTRKLWISRIATAVFGLLQVGIAIATYHMGATESIVNSVLGIASFALGPLLGLYLLAVLTARVQQRAALAGFFVGVASISAIALTTNLYWAWYAVVGALLTLFSGYLVSYCIAERTSGNPNQENLR